MKNQYIIVITQIFAMWLVTGFSINVSGEEKSIPSGITLDINFTIFNLTVQSGEVS